MNIVEILVSLGVGSYITTKLLDRRNRFLDARKEIYSEIVELFSGFFSTTFPAEREEKLEQFLKYYRQIQLWGSPEVVRGLGEFLKIIDVKSSSPQEVKDLSYKKVVIAMRNDLLKENLWPNFIRSFRDKNTSDLREGDVSIYGSIK